MWTMGINFDCITNKKESQTKTLLQALHDKIIKTLQMLLYFRWLNNSLSQPYLASSEQVPYWHSGDLIVSIEGYLCYNMLSK